MDASLSKRSEAVGRRVRLPAGARRPIVVYVNGVAKREGSDYDVKGNEIVFRRAIVKERVSRARWLAMFLGLFGSYERNDVVDVEYRRGGRPELISDAPVLPD